MNIEELRRQLRWVIFNHEQDVADEERPAGTPSWDQESWATGRVDPTERLKVSGEKIYGTDEIEVIPVACASGCCFAGNTVISNGDKFIVPSQVFESDRRNRGVTLDTPVSVEWCITAEGGEVSRIEERALDILGIDEDSAEGLFSGSNDVYDIARICNFIAINHGHDLDVPEAVPYLHRSDF